MASIVRLIAIFVLSSATLAPLAWADDSSQCDAYNQEKGEQWCRMVLFAEEHEKEASCKAWVCGGDDNGNDCWSWSTSYCPWNHSSAPIGD